MSPSGPHRVPRVTIRMVSEAVRGMTCHMMAVAVVVVARMRRGGSGGENGKHTQGQR